MESQMFQKSSLMCVRFGGPFGEFGMGMAHKPKGTYNLTSILWHSIIRHHDYTTHFPSTKLSSVDWPPYYNYDTCNAIVLGPIYHTVNVINVDEWWDWRIFRSLYVVRTLKHA